MKIIRKICKPDKAMQEYLKANDPDCNELLYITDWKGGKIYSATNEWRRTTIPHPAVGRKCLLCQTHNSITEIWEDSEERIAIYKKWCKENNLPEEIDDYEVVYVFEE